MSAGGALGGVFVSLVAPVVFKTFFEWKLGLGLSFVVAALAVTLTMRRQSFLRAFTGIAAVAALGLLISFLWNVPNKAIVLRARNFYGVVSVFKYEQDKDTPIPENVLRHGVIKHGQQYATPDDAETRRIPLSYYGRTSGVGRALERLQHDRPKMRVGVIGLGVGTMASYARKNDDYRFYEINPKVRWIAEDSGYFTYLSDARQRGAAIEMVMGDGRLSLEREPPQKFDLLVLDAFSGDSIPAHLLTREAFAIYRRHMAPSGVIAVHITNSYLYLAPVVRGLAKDANLGMTRIFTARDKKRNLERNDWMLLSEDGQFLAAFPSVPRPEYDDDFEIPLWTDHYNNLFKILK
jgi:hypothetical protein